MHSAAGPEWVIREDADVTVLVALCLRQMIGVRAPETMTEPGMETSGDGTTG